MENVMPEMTPEMADKAAEDKAMEIVHSFLGTINDQITDAVTQVTPEMKLALAKACALTHIKPFVNPLDKVPHDMLNGAALERLQLVKEFWDNVVKHINLM